MISFLLAISGLCSWVFAIAGLLILARGRIQITEKRLLRGSVARSVGALLVIPLPLILLIPVVGGIIFWVVAIVVLSIIVFAPSAPSS